MSIVLDGTNGISDVDGSASTPAIRGTDANTGIFFPAADTVAISEGGVESARFNSSGNLQLVNSLSVGNATPTTSGAGITFPATQSASSDANTLDDYEEGTFTLVVAPASGSLTSYSQEGFYTKIGRFVSVSAAFSITSAGTASGSASLSGFPFTAATMSTISQLPAIVREVASTGNAYQIFINSNATTGTIVTLTNGSIVWTNGYKYSFCLNYFV